MIAFPVFNDLRVANYGMYPGQDEDGLAIEFQPGITMVLGANGLGKTTLVTMLFRMCTGPFDIPGLARGGELGNRSIDEVRMSAPARRIFAARVADDAADATATLRFNLGACEFRITRSLRDLSIKELFVGGKALKATEDAFQDAVLHEAKLSTFGDWILVLRHLIFYFEDRRALVWDTTAQRQILRLLFLPTKTAQQWTALEREVLQRDSRVRNFQAVLTREEAAVVGVERAVSSTSDVKHELATLEALQAIDEPRLDALNAQFAEVDDDRQTARLARLRAELDREHAYRDLERLELRAMDAAFPSEDATAKYLFAKLFADDRCLTCGSSSPRTVAELKSRLAEHQCVVCGTQLEISTDIQPLTPRAIQKATAKLAGAENAYDTSAARAAIASQEFESLVQEVQKLNAAIAHREAEIASLTKRLPPAESDLIEQRADLDTLRGRVEGQKAELEELRNDFATFIDQTNREIARQTEAVQGTFETFVHGFLLEHCTLKWGTHGATVGQGGKQVEFPAFRLEMGGTDFVSPVRRTGPEQVSESQREFIDLAFRMTLMTVAGVSGVGSLVIDAPESSLDAVFVTRAASVLMKFGASESNNRLVVTSNLIEGDLIPALLHQANVTSADDKRVVDLLNLAAPTAATRELGSDYREVRERLFKRAREL